MLHELLYALLGHCGSIFVKLESGKIKVANGIPHLHPSEEELLNRLCELATSYEKCNVFALQNKHCSLFPPVEGQREGTRGLYRDALARAIDEALTPYRDAIVQVEKEILKDPYLSLAHVQVRLDPYYLLIPPLASVIEHVENKQVHGCKILDELRDVSTCAVPRIRAAVSLLEQEVSGVLFKQISSWMLYGELQDPFLEFFIQPQVEQENQEDTSEEESSQGSSSSKLNTIKSLSTWQYCFRKGMLPSHITVRMAEKILFSGEAVKKYGTDHQRRNGVEFDGIRRSIFGEKEIDYTIQFYKLSQDVFNFLTVQKTVDEVHRHVTGKLWDSVMKEGDLMAELENVKDFFLLGRGELFLSFIDEAGSILQGVPKRNTEYDTNNALLRAGRSILFHDEQLLQRVQLRVPYTTSSESPTKSKPLLGTSGASGDSSKEPTANKEPALKETGWQLLNMEFEVEWPAHMVLSPAALKRYNNLFQFLLHIRRVQVDLQRSWSVLMRENLRTKSQPDDALRGLEKNKLILRNHMAFLVDNLQYYLQVDVIESQFSMLLEKLNKTRDFDTVCTAHDAFVTTLLAQCFAQHKTNMVFQNLQEILELCSRFTAVVLSAEDLPAYQQEELMQEISRNFQRYTSLLFKILSSVRDHQSSPHLAQLLLRLDFNKYLTEASGKLGSLKSVIPIK